MTDNPPKRIYVNQIESRIRYTIKTGCYVEFWTPEMINLLGNTKSNIFKSENGKNVPY